MADGPSFRQGLEHFAQSLTANFASSTPAQPEDQLKAPLQALLKSGATLANRRVVVRTEAQVRALGGRPDLAVDIDGLLAGYIELKAPGLGARPQNFRDKHSVVAAR